MENYFITVGRQFGSGGHEIGEKVAKALNINFYDTEIIEKAAKNVDISENVIEKNDEVLTGNVFTNWFKATFSPGVGGFGSDLSVNMQSANAQFEAIREIAKKHSAVIVGRCADYILQTTNNIIKVFISADMEHRIERICDRRNLNAEQAEKLIRQVDKQRAAYYNFHTDQKWGVAEYYDIALSSSKFTVEGAAELIVKSVKSLGLE